MNRTLGIERTYSLGNYKNIRVTDIITDVPEEWMLNEEITSKLRLLQLMRADSVYYTYLKKSPTYVDGITTEDAIEAIDKITISTTEKLYKATASKKEEKE